MTKFVKTCFVIIGCVTLAMFLYYNLFGYKDNKGGIYYACTSAEKPIARYYDKYGRQSRELWDKVDASSLIGSTDNIDTKNQQTILDVASISHTPYEDSY